jgi:hypothetical protein
MAKATPEKTPEVSTSKDLAAMAGKLPAEMRAKLEEDIATDIARIGATGGGDVIRAAQNKTFESPDGTTYDEFECHIVAFTYRNEYYDTPYNAKEITPPKCFAIATSESILVSSENSPDRQNPDSCAVCQHNQFGSSPTTAGKACKNNVLLAILPTDPKTIADHDIMIVKLSPTAIRPFNKYVKEILSQNVPINLAKTRVYFDEGSAYASIRLEVVGFNADHYDILESRKDEATRRLAEEPDVSAAA